jgi:hypothetical protein
VSRLNWKGDERWARAGGGGVFLELHGLTIAYHGIERKASGMCGCFCLIRLIPVHPSRNQMRIFQRDPDLKSEITDLKPDRSENSDLSTELKYGSRLRVFCKLNRDDEYLNPGVIPKREVLRPAWPRRDWYIKSRLLVQELADESVFIRLPGVYNQRARLINEFHQNLDGQTAGIMIASLLGDKYFLDRNTAELFREGGYLSRPSLYRACILHLSVDCCYCLCGCSHGIDGCNLLLPCTIMWAVYIRGRGRSAGGPGRL